MHSRSFRRLEYKTQVFLNGTGDHLRTRLTHTIEVASISRTIARSLGLNEDLAEAIALAHDLGHAPFGHSGEEMLDSLMCDEGGFEHNAQSLRVVEMIEKKYPGFPGLNLSFEVLEGMKKHQKFHERAPGNGVQYTCPSLEAQIANLADEITYYSHDIDDGLDFDLITVKQLSEMEIWQESYEQVRSEFPELKGRELTTDVIRRIIDRQVEDVIVTSFELIKTAGVKTADEARTQKKALIRYSARRVQANRRLRKFLYANLYFHPRVSGVNRARVPDAEECIQGIHGKTVAAGRDGLAADAQGGAGAHGVRLSLRHDRPLPARGAPAAFRGRDGAQRARQEGLFAHRAAERVMFRKR